MGLIVEPFLPPEANIQNEKGYNRCFSLLTVMEVSQKKPGSEIAKEGLLIGFI